MSVLAYAKSHPYQIAGGIFAGGVIVILLLKAKAGGSAAAAPVIVSASDPGYNAETLSANTALQATQLQAQAHAVDTQAALQQSQSDNDTALQIATLQYGSQDTTTAAYAAYATHLADVQAGTTGAQLSAAESIVSMNNNSTIAQAQINEGVQITEAGLSANVQNNAINTTGTTQQLGITTAAATADQQIAAQQGVASQGIAAQQDVLNQANNEQYQLGTQTLTQTDAQQTRDYLAGSQAAILSHDVALQQINANVQIAAIGSPGGA